VRTPAVPSEGRVQVARIVYALCIYDGASLMPNIKLPLSGNVTQTINPWTFFFNPTGSQVGLFNIDLGVSSDPAVERQVISDVASYGKQLGRIEDALLVLLAHFHPKRKLTHTEDKAIKDLKRMIEDIEEVKARYETSPKPNGKIVKPSKK
jgi:hypothetical protein